jgi:hypothetical protein
MRLCHSRKAHWLISWLSRAVAEAVVEEAVVAVAVGIVHSRLNHLQ